MRHRLRQLRAPLRSRSLTLLLTAQLLSGAGDWAARVALAVLVFEKTDSAGLTGLVVTVSVLPWVGIGQVLATLGDRLPRKHLMIACDLIRAATFLAMAIPMPIGALFVLAFVAALPTPPFAAARSALLPETVPANQYPDALALATIVMEGTSVLGYLLGGILVAVIGARGALVVNALSFLASAATLSGLRIGRIRTSKSNRPPLRDGARALWNDLMVRRAVVFFAGVNLGAIIPESLATVYALKHLGAGDTAAGLLAAAVPLGMIVVVSSVPLENHSAHWLLRAAGVIAASGAATSFALFALDMPLPAALLAFVAAGVTFGSAIPTNTVAGTRLPNESRASAFGLVNGALLAANAAGAALGGLLAAVFSVRAACLFGMALVLAIGLWGMLTAPRERTSERPAHGTSRPVPPAPPPVAITGANGNGAVGRQPPAPPPRPVEAG